MDVKFGILQGKDSDWVYINVGLKGGQ